MFIFFFCALRARFANWQQFRAAMDWNPPGQNYYNDDQIEGNFSDHGDISEREVRPRDSVT